MALTLPQDTIEYLQGVDTDLGWAIVKLADSGEGGDPDLPPPQTAPPDVALVPIAKHQFLIVVRAHEAFASLPGVDLVPLGHGQAFLAFRSHSTIEGLELSLIDRLEGEIPSTGDTARLRALRDVLRSWRRDQALTFHERSIVVVERRSRARKVAR
ncbi:hypothetical protein LuPra_03414 [Luteitalea pratensis]|uniref:Uncharacterized protein n=1 Tax=Luteitalea pratensis TaxID=1855912 RepID=A0A143PNM6_LUTPR|nr:hypothetical protein LuPra_03414 [Luteitalea pratensis]